MKKLTIKPFTIVIFLAYFNLNAQEKPVPAILGSTFPDFKMLTHEGKQVWFSDLKGKKTILIFPRGKVTNNHWCNICHYQYAELAKLEIEKKIKARYKIEIFFVLPYPMDSVLKWQADMSESLKVIEKYKNPENPDDPKQKKWAETIRNICPESIVYKDDKYPFPFPILVDVEHIYSSKLDLYREEWNGSRTAQNIPAIFILDKNGVVKFKYLSQNTFDRPNVDYMLEFVRKLM